MGYVIAGILVLLIVGGFVTFAVLNSMRKGAGASDPSAARSDRGGPPGTGRDATPLGDTSEHAGRQTEHGTTAEDPEGEDTAEHGIDPAATPRPEDRQAGTATPRPEDRQAGTGAPRPESERLADRPR